jgi:hypothetical protein
MVDHGAIISIASVQLWQGRFRSFPIQEDLHLFTVQRSIERNAL